MSSYDNCRDWGWNDAVKRKELNDPEGRYILARERATNRLVGFAHVRFMLDGEVKICYL